MEKRVNSIREILVYLVIIFLPIMSIVNVFGKVRINMALSDVFAGLIILMTLMDYKSFSFRRNFPYWWYFAGLMGLMIISNTFAYFNPNIASGSILSALNEFIKFAIAGVYFFIGYNCLDNKDKLTKVSRVWTCTALTVSIIGIVMIFISKQFRLASTLTDPNLAATYLGVSFYICLLFLNTITKKSDKYLGIISLIVIACAIVLTQSRSGNIGFIASLLIYFALNIKKLYKYVTAILLIVFIAYFGFLNLDAVYFNKQFSNSLDHRMEEMLEGKGEAISRLNLAKAAFMMGKDHFLFGVGRGNYPFNSEQYHKKLGIDTTTEAYNNKFSILIPHNTYMAFFAELGILGLMLFLSIFYKAFKLNLRRDYFSKLVLCLLTLYLVQAIALNLENFRGIWFVLGIVLTNRNVGSFNINMKNEPHIISTKKIYIWNFALAVLAILVFINAVPHYTKPILLDKELQSQYIENLKPGEQYVLRYLIKTETKDISKSSSRISIYGMDYSGGETLLNQITHYEPNGYGNLVFVPNENIKAVRIEVDPLDIGNANISIDYVTVINAHTGYGQKVFVDYKFVSDSIEQYLIKAGLIKETEKVDMSLLNLFVDKIVDNEVAESYTGEENIVYFDGSKPINLSNKVLFLGATAEQMSEGKVKLSFRFKCIGKMDIYYRIWLEGLTTDKGILSEDRRDYKSANWNHALEVSTTEWQVGRTYEHIYIIDTIPGQYNLSFGFWNPKWKDGKLYRLYPGINLGNIQIK